MNCFKLPKGVCEDIEKSLAAFWWRSDSTKQGLHWFRWNRLCLPKREGGLGFRDISRFNEAMLAKQAWRIMQTPNSLASRVLKGRYFASTDLLHAELSTKPSYLWRSLLVGRDLLRKGLRFLIGNGSSVHFWTDPWLPTNPPRAPMPLPFTQSDNSLLVGEVIHPHTGVWNMSKLQELLPSEEIHRLKLLKLSSVDCPYMLGWHYTTSGLYTVKSGFWVSMHLDPSYPLIPSIPGSSDLKVKVWKLNTAPKLKHFLWRILCKSLATGEVLQRRHLTSDSQCVRCCNTQESSEHLFFSCSFAMAVWRGSQLRDFSAIYGHVSFEQLLDAILEHVSDSRLSFYHRQLPLWILWRLWKARNRLIFQRKDCSWNTVLQQAIKDASEWMILDKDTNSRTVRSTTSGWMRPPIDFVKCNYDCSFRQGHVVKSAWVVRDSQGVFKEAAISIGQVCSEAIEGELQSLLMAIQHLWSRGYRKIICEGDNVEVAQLFPGKGSISGIIIGSVKSVSGVQGLKRFVFAGSVDPLTKLLIC